MQIYVHYLPPLFKYSHPTHLQGIILCSDKLQMKLRGEGGIRALLGMVRCRHPDVLAQVARGIANFAKCESRASTQGNLSKIGSL